MATQLKPVDVAVIGLGAAGGVAVLPLARAGLKVAGIEAGTWMGPQGLSRRRDLQQCPPPRDFSSQSHAGNTHGADESLGHRAPGGGAASQ